MTTMADAHLPDNGLKRKRSPSISSPAPPPAKAVKPSNALQINYLARQSPQDLPLINKSETIPGILDVLSAYSSVLDRHESLASNLGARPLGPILIKRFERCFDSPPQIIASHSHAKDPSETPQVTWLEVIQFAQSHPGQFTLSTFSEGRRVCQFYYPQKQVRVQVTEEDFLFIKSGRCQDLIPPLPIWEDEEKEVGTCEILEKHLRELTNAADTVAARTRQLAHRLKSRRMAIMERRAAAKDGQGEVERQESTHDHTPAEQQHPRTASGGFAAVNGQSQGSPAAVNGEPTTNVSVKSDLMRHFQSLTQNQTHPDSTRRQQAAPLSHPAAAAPAASPTKAPAIPSHNYGPPAVHSHPQQAERPDPLSYYLSDPAPPPPLTIARPPSSSNQAHPTVATPTSTHPSASRHNFSRPLAPGAEMTQPFRTLCQTHMESLPRGSRVMPPCDRCRRLKMDCLKNLTSCQGCTKKHARCHWREVDRAEVEGLEGFGGELMDYTGGERRYEGSGSGGSRSGGSADGESEDEGGALEDLEALERESEEGRERMEVDRAGDRDRQVVAASGGESVAEAVDRARDVYRGGQPYPSSVRHEDRPASAAPIRADLDAHHSRPSSVHGVHPSRPMERPAEEQRPPQSSTSFRPSGFTSVNHAAQPNGYVSGASTPRPPPSHTEQQQQRQHQHHPDPRSANVSRVASPLPSMQIRPEPSAVPTTNGYDSARGDTSDTKRATEQEAAHAAAHHAERADRPFPGVNGVSSGVAAPGVSVGGGHGWRGA